MTMVLHYQEPARTVHFGRDILQRAPELLSDDFDGIFIVATERLSSTVETLCLSIGARHAHTQIGATVHVPTAEVDSALEAFDAKGARSVLAIGGGSAIGLGKAVARRRGVPLAAVPTTYAGSEMTPVWGETRGGIKITGRDEAARPCEVMYDVALTETMPTGTSVASAFNALAHAMEALYAPDATPVSHAIASEAVGKLCAAVRSFAETAAPSPAAREQALQGAWLAGHVLGSTTMSLHHKLCHILGGSCNLPHADVHAVLLPSVLETCAGDARAVYAIFSDALGTAEPHRRLREIAAAAGVPTSLQHLGVTAEQLEQVRSALGSGGAQGHYAFDPSRALGVLRSAWSST